MRRPFTVSFGEAGVFTCIVVIILFYRNLCTRPDTGHSPYATSQEFHVDIVITVHDALRVVKSTIASIEASELNFRQSLNFVASFYIVDANSSSSTAEYLQLKAPSFACNSRVKYIRQVSSSYTQAVNMGISLGSAKSIIVLNSDVIVPFFWVSPLILALNSSPRTGMVGPLSNSACYQSLPLVTPHQWSHNLLQPGVSVEDMNHILGMTRPADYPAVPLLNGFMFAMRRDVFREVGGFDEIKFPHGYGEENDFCLKVRKAGFFLRIVDNLFVYHSKSASFGEARRRDLIRAASLVYSEELHRYIALAYEELLNLSTLTRIRNQMRSALQERKKPVS